MIHIGFTGTQKGLTKFQAASLVQVLHKVIETWVPQGENFLAHHGDCIGADDDFDRIVRQIGADIFLHPCNIPDKRAHCEKRRCWYILDEEPPLVRNQRIVDRVQVMIGCPRGYEEQRRSGTWFTIRYARKKKKPLYIIYPDGKVMHEKGH